MTQPAALLAGVLVLALSWLGPLPDLARHAFSAHMTMHVAVVAVAAPLLALGLSGSRLDPVGRAPRLFAPIPASIVELVVVWAWHAPALHEAARTTAAARALEQGMFLGAGLLLWLSAVGGGAILRRARAGAGVAGLLFTSMHMTLLGVLFALAPRALYTHGAPPAGASTPLADQHVGGVVMLLVGGLSYLWGGLWLTRQLLQTPRFSGPAGVA